MLNSFVAIVDEARLLKRMQLGHPEWNEWLLEEGRESIGVNVRLGVHYDHNALFSRPKTGYFEYKGERYYRNCNIVSKLGANEFWYQAFLKGACLHVKLLHNNERLVLEVTTTPTYARLSRSRLLAAPSLEGMINNILLALSVVVGKLPLHSAALSCSTVGGEQFTALFLGLPNTGKTTTSMLVDERLGGQYVSEDITFVDTSTLISYSSPKTSLNNVPEIVSSNNTKYVFYLSESSDTRFHFLELNK